MQRLGLPAAILLACASGAIAADTQPPLEQPPKEETVCRPAPAAISRPGKRRLCLTAAGWEKIYARYPEFSRMSKKEPDEIKREQAIAPPAANKR